MPTPGPWIQPDDIFVNLAEGTFKTTTRRGWQRGLNWRGPSQAGSFATYQDAYHFLNSAEPIVYPDIESWLPEYSGAEDSLGGLPSFHRGWWGQPDSFWTYEAGIRSAFGWMNIACTLPAGKPANPTPASIPEGATVEWETPTGEYSGEILYSVMAWASHSQPPDGWAVNETGSGRVLIKPELGPTSGWPGIDALKGAGWTVSAPISEQTTLEFLLPSLEACVTGMPSQIYDEVPLPDVADSLVQETFYVGVPVAAPGSTPAVRTDARYVPPRYRFVYDSVEVAGGGLWNIRQRQTATGNAAGWPLRQRHKAGATGAWPLRQRQHGS